MDNHFDYERVTDGLKLAAWGMFMKVIIADRLAEYVNGVYNNLPEATGVSCALAILFFAVQIYCDFAGYSNIAIGSAQILGFRLMKNFNHPYFSKSIPEFWRRWHISLSSWLRDYVYIPLGGSRVSVPRTYLNLFITFFVSGVWHGAAWNFIAWGALHGVYMILSRLTFSGRKKIREKIHLEENGSVKRPWQFVQVFITFALVCVGWVFFRANSMTDTVVVFRKIASIPNEAKIFLGSISNTGLKDGIRNLFLFNDVTDFGFQDAIRAFFLCGVLFVCSVFSRKKDGVNTVKSYPAVLRWILYYILIIALFVLKPTEQGQFIYFQF